MMKSCCGYTEDKIPDLEVASRFLKERTGFRLRPVAGQLTPRDFLSSLAFRIFCCTQYIRHRSEPFYSPEPDVCHEMLGHVPMLSDPAFAEFSQEIGLACLGAPDEYVDKLSSLYWYSVEFGICMESDGLKGYGAGVLSSAAEMKNAIESNEVQRLPFDAHKMAEQKISYVGLQNTYYYPETFEEAMKKIREFATSIPRPFQFRYDPYTERLLVVNHREDMALSMRKIEEEMKRLQRAVGKLDL
jgi:phenylalanine-4-hydroxylase